MLVGEGDGEADEDGGRREGGFDTWSMMRVTARPLRTADGGVGREMASTRSSEEEPMARRGSRERGKLVGLGAGARVDAGDDDRVVGGDASFEG